MKKKIIVLALSFVALFAFAINFGLSIFAASSTSWNFKNTNFKSLGTI